MTTLDAGYMMIESWRSTLIVTGIALVVLFIIVWFLTRYGPGMATGEEE